MDRRPLASFMAMRPAQYGANPTIKSAKDMRCLSNSNVTTERLTQSVLPESAKPITRELSCDVLLSSICGRDVCVAAGGIARL